MPPLVAARAVALPLPAPAAPLSPLLAAAATSLRPATASAAAGGAPPLAAAAAPPPAQMDRDELDCGAREPQHNEPPTTLLPTLTVSAISSAVDRPLFAGPCLMQSSSGRAGDVSSGGGRRGRGRALRRSWTRCPPSLLMAASRCGAPGRVPALHARGRVAGGGRRLAPCPAQ